MHAIKKRTKSLTTPNKLRYSLQVSALPSAQLSPRSSSNPRTVLSAARESIEHLAEEVRRRRKERGNLQSMEEQARDSGDALEQRIGILKKPVSYTHLTLPTICSV
eukprot:TRINITY_DN5431_c0_g1_i1.p1 TRINITY_DN5431_c0_g1~~TRINITY_DN5431_c0_g1_i1.p1  ORF type:complete len:106 (-),score=26.75 TRINITY_DN5431_c0_g1_i1:34-351(-)